MDKNKKIKKMQERKYRNVFNRRKTEQMKIKIEIER